VPAKRQFRIAIRKDETGQDVEYAVASPVVHHPDGSMSSSYFRGSWDEIVIAEEIKEND
jgi:hypothetical protein